MPHHHSQLSHHRNTDYQKDHQHAPIGHSCNVTPIVYPVHSWSASSDDPPKNAPELRFCSCHQIYNQKVPLTSLNNVTTYCVPVPNCGGHYCHCHPSNPLCVRHENTINGNYQRNQYIPSTCMPPESYMHPVPCMHLASCGRPHSITFVTNHAIAHNQATQFTSHYPPTFAWSYPATRTTPIFYTQYLSTVNSYPFLA